MFRQIITIILIGLFTFSSGYLNCGFNNTNNCSPKAIRDCSLLQTDVPYCFDNNTRIYSPPVVNASCCPSCIPFNCSCNWTSILRCTDYSNFMIDDNRCPSCRPERQCLTNCTVDPKDIRPCNTGEKPTLNNETCCLSCIAPFGFCNKTQITECNATIPSFPKCDANSTGSLFSREACCIANDSCVCPKVNISAVCTNLEYMNCVRDAPVCRPFEMGCYLEGRCCRTCIPWQFLHNAADVAKCLMYRRDCLENEEPVDLEQEICKSCVRPWPLCNKTCSDDNMCVFVWDFSNDAPKKPLEMKCVKKTVVIYAITSTVAEVLSTIKSLNAKATYFFLRHIVSKYCDKPERDSVCRPVLSNLRNMRVFLQPNGNIGVEVPEDQIQTPEDSDSELNLNSKRSILGSVADVLNSALTDPVAASSLSVTQETFSPTSTPADSTPTPADSTPTPADSTPTPADSTPTPADSTPTPADSPAPSGSTSLVISFITIVGVCALWSF